MNTPQVMDLQSDRKHRANNTRRRLNAIIGHLEICATLIDQAETELAEKEENAAWGTRTVSETRSTISSRFVGDPTGTRALAPDNNTSTRERRQLLEAISSAERAVNHLRHTIAHTAGTATTDTTKEQRCPEMTLRWDGHDYTLTPCGALTDHTRRPDGSTTTRQDQLCHHHGRTADDNERRARESNSRRQRRHTAA